MKYLLEHEVGFDTGMLGFPSIQGCHAIVFQTSEGIYGYHNAGGSGRDAWQPRAQRFREFVESLGELTPATRLYGCSYVGNNQRGYSGTPATAWVEELAMFASMLNYGGKISGYDLSKKITGTDTSAYVEYRINGKKCDVYIRKWHQHGIDAHPQKIANPDPDEQKQLTPSKYGPARLDNLVNVVDPGHGPDRNNLTKISKQQLR